MNVAIKEQRPTPPEGFYWYLDMGGLRMARSGFNFRLWFNDIGKYGYEPKSE